MAGGPRKRLALLIRGRPYRQRAARADLDFALAAATLDFDLDLYFIGVALLQLAARRDGTAALLPAGYRAWAALPELTRLRAYAERAWLERCARDSIDLLLPVQALDAVEMRARWRQCRHALLL
jgi:sulfur relay (sulfurtransferase) DsrF/TusC family protein